MAKYDLTGSLETNFNFEISGREFNFRKPTVREMKSLAKEFASIEKEEDVTRQAEMQNRAMESIYRLITPVNHNDRFADLLEDQPVGAQIAFNEMIQAELGA